MKLLNIRNAAFAVALTLGALVFVDANAQTCSGSTVVVASGQTCSSQITTSSNGTTFNNAGTISTDNPFISTDAIQNATNITIASIVNSGTIGGYFSAITLRSGSVISSINNSGSIYGNQANGFYIQGGVITNLVNTGSVYSLTVDGMYLNSTASIGTLTNAGSIYFAGSPFHGISNGAGGTITTLNNLQGGNGAGHSTTALDYYGRVPTNYNIIIRSPTEFGQLAVSNTSGTTTFGIYSGGVSGIAASTVAVGTYSSVLSGISAGNLNNTSGVYGGLNWTLVNSSGSVWDLIFSLAGPSSSDTQSSLQLSANVLKNIYALQASTITSGLSYDCNVFDKNGICVSTGGRYSRVNTGNTQETNGLLIGAYKVSPNIRVGAWLDQNLSSNTATGVSLNNGSPMFGVYGVWNEEPTGQGAELKVSAGYGDRDLTVTRQVVGTGEAGSGTARLNTQGVSAVASYNLPVNSLWTASPYLGVRYAKVGASGYTEQTSSAVTAPLTYNRLNQESTTALAGIKVSGRMSQECGVFASAGVEQDLNSKAGQYSASGVTGLTAIALNPNVKKTRGTVSAGTYYDVDKTQRVSLSAVYREEAFTSMNSLSSMLMYTAGF